MVCLMAIGLSFDVVVAANYGVISGKVTHENSNTAIYNALVYIYDPADNILDSTLTDDRGFFRFEKEAGQYKISAEKDNLVKEFFPGEYRIVEAQQIRVSIGQYTIANMSLDEGGTISGIFDFIDHDTDKGLITALKIDYPQEGLNKSITIQGAFPQSYTISGLLPGTYKILGRARGKRTEYFPGVSRIEDAVQVTVHQNEETAGISFLLRDVGWGTITGRVFNVNSNEGISGAQICAHQWIDFWQDPNLETTQSDADGLFSIDAPAGDYYVFVRCESCSDDGNNIIIYYDNQYDPLNAQTVRVDSSQTVPTIDFAIDRATPHEYSISGTVSNSANGTGLVDIVVSAIDYETGKNVNSTYTNGYGEFMVGNLPGGQYLLMFSGTYIMPFFYPQTCNWQSGEIITVSGHVGGIQSEAITQDYGNMGLAINGTVTSDSGPISDARVYAYPVGDDRPIAYAKSNSAGEYSIIGGLVSGSYYVTCDYIGFNSQTYPSIVNVNLADVPFVYDIDFHLEPYITGIFEHEPVATKLELGGNYPNPFNSKTNITIYSSGYEDIRTRLNVYNLTGQIVGHKLVTIKPGISYITWGSDDFGQSVPSGVYFYKIDGISQAKRMLLIK